MTKIYYKVMNRTENHHGYQYYDGYNKLSPQTQPQHIRPEIIRDINLDDVNGFYFTDVKHIFEFMNYSYGHHIRKITVPDNHKITKIDNVWKSDGITLGDRFELSKLSTFKMLIEQGADVNAGEGQALKWAAYYDHMDHVQYLIKNGAKINTTHNISALSDAASNNNFDIMRYLIKHGADVNHNNGSILRNRALRGSLEAVKILVENGANIHTEDDAALFCAITYNHLNVVKYLIEKGINVHSNNDFALRIAAEKGYQDIVAYLIEIGANVRVNNDEVYRTASDNNYFEIIKILATHGADINADQGKIMISASRFNRLDIIQFLIDKQIKITDHIVHQMITMSAKHGYLKIIRYLFDSKCHKINSDSINEALYLAADNSRINIVIDLVGQRNANINYLNDIALRCAVYHNYYELVKYLIDAGANVQNEELFEMAFNNKQIDIIRYLIENGIDARKYWNRIQFDVKN